MKQKPDISAVQQGDRRVEYHRPAPPPLRSVRDGGGRLLTFWIGILFLAVWSITIGGLAFSVGVDRGYEIGADSCAPGDVYVDPAVTEGVD